MKDQLKNLVATAPEHISSRFHRHFYPKGTLILPQKDPTQDLYIIECGIVEVMKESYSGSLISVNTFEAGSFFGEIEIFCPELAPYKVSAKTDCRLLLVPKDTVFAWMSEVFAFTHFVCETFARRLYLTSDSMSRIAMLPLKDRVLGSIDTQYQMGTLGNFTKQMLVSQTRAPLRSVNRIVRECIEEGIIDYRRKTFVVLDKKLLETYAKEYAI